MGGQHLVGVQDAFGVQEGLELPHELQRLGGLAVAEDVLLLEAQAMLGTDAAPLARRPLVHVGLQGSQQGRAEGLGRHVEVQVAVPWRGRDARVNLFTINLEVLLPVLHSWRSLETIGRIKLKFRGRRLKPKPVKTIQLLTTQNIKE